MKTKTKHKIRGIIIFVLLLSAAVFISSCQSDDNNANINNANNQNQESAQNNDAEVIEPEDEIPAIQKYIEELPWLITGVIISR